MKNIANRKIFVKILKYFIIWRISLFLVAFMSMFLITKFGNRFPYVDRVLMITNLPNWIWGFGNFDGVHYLRLAQNGYSSEYTQAFFPFYPLLIRLFNVFPKGNLDPNLYVDPSYFYIGIILSNLFLIFALYISYKLIRLDFSEKIANLSIILLLVFPTSFFFGSIYTESLFLFLSVFSFYLIRKKSYFWASIFIAFSTATRIIGILLIPVYFIEVFRNKNKINYIWSLITPTGIIIYIIYLIINFNNPFYFLTSLPSFGTGRDITRIVLLPQVIYRYMKIFFSVKIISLSFFNALLEFIFTLIPLGLLVVFFKKMRFSYWFFSISSLLLGTLTGTLTSMPRYVIISMIFIFPFIITKYRKYLKIYIAMSTALAVFLIMLFIRGYWIA